MNRREERLYRQDQDRWIWIIQELFVDVLAKFGVGVVAIISVLFSVLGPIGLSLGSPIQSPTTEISKQENKTNFPAIVSISLNAETPTKSPTKLRPLHDVIIHHINKIEMNNQFHVIMYIFGFFFSYMVGSLLERLSLKRADELSTRFQIWKRTRRKWGPPLLFWRCDWYQKPEAFDSATELACDPDTDGCEFPYLHLKRYLSHRGLSGLADKVYWDESHENYRSRNYIDILKIRIRYYGGSDAMHVVRNEVQIRLASSAWHVSVLLILPLSVASIIIVSWYSYVYDQSAVLYYMVPSIITLLFSLFVRRAVMEALHDLRLREVVQILATACMLYHDDKETFGDIFDKCFELGTRSKDTVSSNDESK